MNGNNPKLTEWWNMFQHRDVITHICRREGPTLRFNHVHDRLGAHRGGGPQGSDPGLGRVHHSFQQRHAVFGAAVGAGDHLACRADQGQVGHPGDDGLTDMKCQTGRNDFQRTAGPNVSAVSWCSSPRGLHWPVVWPQLRPPPSFHCLPLWVLDSICG